jgi:hypothetical protein
MPRRNRLRVLSLSTASAAAALALAALARPAAATEGVDWRGPVASELSFGGVSSTAVHRQACAGSQCDADNMFATGAAIMIQAGPLVVGPSLELATTGFGRKEVAPAMRLGLGFGTARTRLEVIGEGGVRLYGQVGSSFSVNTQGPTPALPFVGGRVGVSYRFGRSGTSMGLWLTARTDLQRQTVVMSLKDDFLCDEDCSLGNATYVVGGSSFGLLGTVRFEMMRHR